MALWSLRSLLNLAGRRRRRGDHAPKRLRKRGGEDAVTPERLRHLRELLRQRYALDLEIWQRRGVRAHDRRVVAEKMARADGLLARARALLAAMDDRANFASDDEYARFGDVRARVEEDGKRCWMQDPPWHDAW